MDLEAYASRYKGYTKARRLLFIAMQSVELRREAFRLCIEELKRSKNVVLLKSIAFDAAAEAKLPGVCGDVSVMLAELGFDLAQDFGLDQAWMDRVEADSRGKLEKLRSDLDQSERNNIKESIRRGWLDLGDFHLSIGDLEQASRCYTRTRDYCTNAVHVVIMCLNVIKVNAELGNFAIVNNFVPKAERALSGSGTSGGAGKPPTSGAGTGSGSSKQEDKVSLAKLKAAAALGQLSMSKYKAAAKLFVQVGIELGESFKDVIASEDIAVYGGLCALATFDRGELKANVIENSSFKSFLELMPKIREMMNSFYGCNYALCLTLMEEVAPELSLDVHLHSHVKPLYAAIRNRALIQYVYPYSSVDLNHMAKAFQTDVSQIQNELSALIVNKEIQARIDSHNKILYARHTDQRSMTYAHALEIGQRFSAEAQSIILRVNMKRENVFYTGIRRPTSSTSGATMPKRKTKQSSSSHPNTLSSGDPFSSDEDDDDEEDEDYDGMDLENDPYETHVNNHDNDNQDKERDTGQGSSEQEREQLVTEGT